MELEEIVQKINEVIERRNLENTEAGYGLYNVAGVLLYGSYVKGTAKKDSDLDMFILTRRNEYYYIPDFIDHVGRRIPMILDVSGWMPYTNKTIGEMVFDKKFLFKGSYHLDTPFEKVRRVVERSIEQARPKPQ